MASGDIVTTSDSIRIRRPDGKYSQPGEIRIRTTSNPMMSKNLIRLSSIVSLTAGIGQAGTTYEEDVAFLKQHTEIIELSAGGSRVAIAPAYQARVMTSAAAGPKSPAFGWINPGVIAAGIKPGVIAAGIKPEAERADLTKHIHIFGGEERLWFGPEGGPFSLFFPPKVEQVFANWKTPAAMDTESFDTLGQPLPTSASFGKSFQLPNRAGNTLSMSVQRTITLASGTELTLALGMPMPEGVQAVAYSTANTVKNTGEKPWTRETGAPSIWMLGMFKPSPKTTIVIPFKAGDTTTLGPRANTEYFGKIPDSRIAYDESTIFFKGDGVERGKLGVTPKRSKGIAGSWQADINTLTLLRIQPSKDAESASWPYVDSQWRDDVDPFGGDVINSYNDGPPEPGAKALGPFYELETSSPALMLKPGESHTHTQTTIHLTGNREALNAIAIKTLGVGLDAIEKALP